MHAAHSLSCILWPGPHGCWILHNKLLHIHLIHSGSSLARLYFLPPELELELGLEIQQEPKELEMQFEPTPASSDGRVSSRCKCACQGPASSRNYRSRGDAQVSRNSRNGNGKVSGPFCNSYSIAPNGYV